MYEIKTIIFGESGETYQEGDIITIEYRYPAERRCHFVTGRIITVINDEICLDISKEYSAKSLPVGIGQIENIKKIEV